MSHRVGEIQVNLFSHGLLLTLTNQNTLLATSLLRFLQSLKLNVQLSIILGSCCLLGQTIEK